MAGTIRPRTTRVTSRGSPVIRLLGWSAAVAAALALAWGLWSTQRAPEPAATAARSDAAPSVAAAPGKQAEVPAHPFGFIDRPLAETVVGPKVSISGWALDRHGIDRVEIRLDGRSFLTRHHTERPDVASIHPGLPDGTRAGFEFEGDFTGALTGRHELTVVAVAADGRTHELGRRALIAPEPLQRWKSLLDERPSLAAHRFYLLPATSGIKVQGAVGIKETYAPYESETMRAGVRVPILYMRTTKGRSQDWVFDPDWDFDRRCGKRRIADDSLASVITFAEQNRLPVLFTLNGGVWADASCDVPEWDINDELEKDPANCQWDARNEVPGDDALRNLTGSQASPELGRGLTLNVYAQTVRAYKKRNLQAAATVIKAFADRHPDLFVGVSLDPDVYMLPWYGGERWFDYNPDTLAQFRHWLRGTGPYARGGERGAPDLSGYRREKPLTLAEVQKLAGRPFSSWDEVDPPRKFAKAGQPLPEAVWNDPWHNLWDQFRRHLVHLHYSELAQWAIDVGFPPEKVYTAQGITGPDPGLRPQALYLDSHMPDYDSAGVSIEGSIPRQGRLGVILYGPNALNLSRMETPESTFRIFQRLAGEWANVEFSTANLKDLSYLPTYADGYRAFREITNFGGTMVSPMAWNGSHGMLAGQPGYQVHTSWRSTPAESAAFDLFVERAHLPTSTKLWTFGSRLHADTDGWSAEAPARLSPGAGFVDLAPTGPKSALLSPAGDYVRADRYDLLVVAPARPEALTALRVFGRVDGSDRWVALTGELPTSSLRRTPAGLVVPLSWPDDGLVVDRVKLELDLAEGLASVRIDHIALYPRAPRGR